MIKQVEISRALGIPPCAVSVALIHQKPLKRIGRTGLYDTNQALDAIKSYYANRARRRKSKYEQEIRFYKTISKDIERMKEELSHEDHQTEL